MSIKLFKRNANSLVAKNGAVGIRWKNKETSKGRQKTHSAILPDVCFASMSDSALSCGVFPPLHSVTIILTKPLIGYLKKLTLFRHYLLPLWPLIYCRYPRFNEEDRTFGVSCAQWSPGLVSCLSHHFPKVWSLQASSCGVGGAWLPPPWHSGSLVTYLYLTQGTMTRKADCHAAVTSPKCVPLLPRLFWVKTNSCHG